MKFNLKNCPNLEGDEPCDYCDDWFKWKKAFEAELREMHKKLGGNGDSHTFVEIKEILGE